MRGKPTALVTIVEFSDFQCPFCKRVQTTIDEVRKKYGDDVRFVFKHNPLPFHPRAEPAAEVALEARAEKGDDGFFRVHDALFEAPKLEDDDLEFIARSAHLDVSKVKKAIASKKYAAAIAEDTDLSEEVKASGTPHFFINGRRLVGAQPIRKIYGANRRRASQGEDRGRSRGSQAIGLRRAAEVGPGRRAAGDEDDSCGHRRPAVPRFARCQDCHRGVRRLSVPVLQQGRGDDAGASHALLRERSRFVWRHRPLAFHPDAHLASEAAVEAFRQKGNDAFWAYRTMLYKNQSSSGGLKKKALLEYADQLGLDQLGLPRLSKITATRRWSTPTRRWPMRRVSTGRHRS